MQAALVAAEHVLHAGSHSVQVPPTNAEDPAVKKKPSLQVRHLARVPGAPPATHVSHSTAQLVFLVHVSAGSSL